MVASKGAHAVAITRCKGHGTEQNVAKGIISAELRRGHHISDADANEGVNTHFAGAVDLAYYLQERRAA